MATKFMIVANFPLIYSVDSMIVGCFPLNATFLTHDHGRRGRAWCSCDWRGCWGRRRSEAGRRGRAAAAGGRPPREGGRRGRAAAAGGGRRRREETLIRVGRSGRSGG